MNLSTSVLRIEVTTTQAALLLAIVAYPYLNISLPGFGWAGGLALLSVGLVLTGALLFVCRRTKTAFPVPPPVASVLIGIVLRILVASITVPELTSDGIYYSSLAERIAAGQSYTDDTGKQAFWPPGYPIYLAAFYFLFSSSLFSLVASNVGLYLVSSLAIYWLAKNCFGKKVAALSLAFLAVWPNHVLFSSLPGKENLTTAACLTAVCCFSFVGPAPSMTKREGWAALIGGLALGFASLSQPGLVGLALFLALACRNTLRQRGWNGVRLALLATFGAAVVVGPWVVRNYRVFGGEFFGIATNGGSVLYRANNELATGSWIEQGKRSLRDLPEIEADRKGKEWALQWILQNPFEMIKLSFRKVLLFLSDDCDGCYWAILRGSGADDGSSRRSHHWTEFRRLSFLGCKIASDFFWLSALAFVLVGLERCPIQPRWGSAVSLLLAPFLYLLAVHSIAESGTRHHIAPFAVLLVIAGFGAVGNTEGARRTSRVSHKTSAVVSA